MHDESIGSATQAPRWLRVSRNGASWTVDTSVDGIKLDTTRYVNHVMTVTEVGPHVGNAGLAPGQEPAFTSQIDYFYNGALPGDGDNSLPPSLSVNAVGTAPLSKLPIRQATAAETLLRLRPTPILAICSNVGAATCLAANPQFQ